MPETATSSTPASKTGTSFADLGVPEALVSVLEADGKTEAFPIQEDTLPDSLAGRDILGRGRTGSGKTLAFAIPLVARLALDRTTLPKGSKEADRGRGRKPLPHPRGLVLAPTRELANQIDEVLAPLVNAYHMRTCTVYGGVKQGRQVDALKRGAQIVVACPGRLEDLLQQKVLSLESVSIAVLDEADEMADMGFLPAVERILSQVRPGGQRMLFSATLDHGVDAVVRRFLRNAKVHEVDSATQHVDQMTHHIFETTQDAKHDLVRRLASGQGKRILFTRTKFQAKKLAKNLITNGIPTAQLHGNLSQNQRDRNLEAFSKGDVRVLVATDVAARGVDISDVDLVVQVDPPADSKSFLHRSGRTARAGRAGDVVTVVLPDQRRDAKRMLRMAHIDAKPVHVTASSSEVDELVGQAAEPIQGWSLESSTPGRSDEGRKEGSRGRSSGARGRSRDRDRRSRDGGPRRGGNRPARSPRNDDFASQEGPIDARTRRGRGRNRRKDGAGWSEGSGRGRRTGRDRTSGRSAGFRHVPHRHHNSSNPFSSSRSR